MRVLLICGSPRKGNSETIVNRISQILSAKAITNEIVLFREKKIERCTGCLEYCNKKLACYKKDDVAEIFEKMKNADAFVFVSPVYFNMPPGIFKDFIDRCCVLYTAQVDFSKKSAIVIVTGSEDPKETEICADNIANNYCEILGMKVVAKKSFKSNSELKGNYNDIFENGYNKNIEKEIENCVEKLIK